MEKYRGKIERLLRLEGISVERVPVLLSCSISLVVLYIKSVDINLTEFYDRAIGHASINGIDAPIRIHTFWICVLIFAVSLFVGNYLISRAVNYISAKAPMHLLEPPSMLFFEFSILLLINLVIFLISFVKDRTTRIPITLPIVFAVICIHLVINVAISPKRFLGRSWLADAVELISPVPLMYFLLLITSVGNSTIEIMSWKSLFIYLLVYLSIRVWCAGSGDVFAAVYSLIPISLLPVTYIIANEMQYTLTKHNFVFRPKIIALIISICLFVLALIIYTKKKGLVNEANAGSIFNNIIIPIFLVTLVMFLNHSQTIEPGFDYLHHGNAIVPAQQLYQFGKIPLLDYMAPQHWPVGPFLYSVFNGCNYYEPVLWHGMFDYSVCVLISYFVLRQFLSARQSALLLCFTPMMAFINTYYNIALLPMLYINRMREKRRFADYGFVILLALAAFAYMPSAGKIAVLASLILIMLSCSSRDDIKHAVTGVLCTVLPLAALYFLLVLVRGESISDRITLISAMASCDIQIGSYTNFIGNNRTPFEILMYYGLFPLMGMLSLFFTARLREKKNVHYLFLFLLIAGVISSLRGFARHSLWEELPVDFYLFILVLIPIMLIKDGVLQRATAGAVIAVLIILPYAQGGTGLANGGIPSFTFQKFEIGSERCDTVNNERYPKNLRKVLDTVLEEDQTFFEGVNAHLLYTLMEREVPFFHHSVQIIYSEPPQEAYIHLFEKAYADEKIPVIIYGPAENVLYAIDGIPAELSLFKLDDFIYTHYEPWIWVDGFHLWKAKNSNLKLPDTDNCLQEISTMPAEDALFNDLSYQFTDNGLALECGTVDPWMVFPVSNVPTFNAGDEIPCVKIVYRSSAPGNLQVFYDFEGFNETDSSVAGAVSSQEYHTVYLPVPERSDQLPLKNIRIDPPNGAMFEIQSISLVCRTMMVEEKNYLKQDFNMQKLPYIWGNYDEKIAKNFPTELQCVSGRVALDAGFPIDLSLDSSIDKEGGNYIYFRINTKESGTLLIQYGTDIVNSCQFDLVAGEQDYLVRISTQYNWVNELQDCMSIQSSVPVEIERISILRGD